MNKQFFKIDKNIYLVDILSILNISYDDFFEVNNTNLKIEDILINDFVPFYFLREQTLSFLSNVNYNLNSPSLGICILEKKNIKLLNDNIIKIPFNNPKLGFSKILEHFVFKKSQHQSYGIHPTAIIHKSAKIGKNVNVGAYSIIHEGVVIENDTYIAERVSIFQNCKIGKKCTIDPGVIIECSFLDDFIKVSSNSVIGKAGFGFIPNNYKTNLMPHIGGVIVGKGSVIGSNCTIDRGLLENTIIGKSVMIDNQVHIGHNCVIDDLCILAGQVGLSGSVHLEKNVTVGGDVSIKDNITIGENSIIAGASKVFSSFPKKSVIGGSPAQDLNDWKKIVASQRLSLKKRKYYKNGN